MKLSLATTVLACALLLVVHDHIGCRAHVRLTWPPARQPDYDFLDNVRTGGPCGVPEDPNGPATTFQAGTTINVTYHLAYPHRGGILVNILNQNGTILQALLGTQQDQWINTDDATRYSHEVVLPGDFECEKCTLQLVRQAAEWTAPGTWGYIFWSCADITVVNSSDAVCNGMSCSGHGMCVNGECECDRLYSGEFCQYKDECLDSSDCSNRGSCIDLQGVSLPRRQCFCSAGWFGDKCSRESTLTDATIEPEEYTLRRQLHERLVLYARIIDDELEVALQHNGTGYVALGWRPSQGIDASCRVQSPGIFPVGANPLWSTRVSWPMVEGADTFYKEYIRPTSPVDVEDGNAESGSSEGGLEEGGSEEGGSEEGGSEEGGSGEGGSEEGGSEEGGSEEGGSEEGGSEEGGSEEGGSEEGGSEEGGSEEGGSGEGGSEEGGSEEGGSEEGGNRAPMHPMDCTDIVIGVARGEQFRVFDYYTRDRATPRRDSFYGGEESLTAAVGKEEDGFTFIKWRRPLDTLDSADHAIQNELTSLIWSFGQVYPDYFHWPASAIEAGTAQNDRFYQPDEIKYHGTRNRGATTINFFDQNNIEVGGPECRGEFSTGCDPQTQGSCDYQASWTVMGEEVEFVVSAKKLGTGTEWVGLGFSNDQLMLDSDAVVGAADDSGYFVTDRYIQVRAEPPIDDSQDITNTQVTVTSGVTTMEFTRPLNSGDPNDLSLTECRYFLYGWGGFADVSSKTIGYHPNTPIVSTDKICLPPAQRCPAGTYTTEVVGGGNSTEGATDNFNSATHTLASLVVTLMGIIMTLASAVLV